MEIPKYFLGTKYGLKAFTYAQTKQHNQQPILPNLPMLNWGLLVSMVV